MNQAFDNYNKFLITLSSGSIAISLTFTSCMLQSKQFCGTYWIHGAWVLWIVTICLNLVSFFTTAKSHEKVIEQINKGTVDTEKKGGVWTSITSVVDISAGFSFLIAIISFCIFGFLNIK